MKDSKCKVSTFGFGIDHDPAMLQAIAEAGSGMYYFIKSPEDIPTVRRTGFLQHTSVAVHVDAPGRLQRSHMMLCLVAYHNDTWLAVWVTAEAEGGTLSGGSL